MIIPRWNKDFTKNKFCKGTTLKISKSAVRIWKSQKICLLHFRTLPPLHDQTSSNKRAVSTSFALKKCREFSLSLESHAPILQPMVLSSTPWPPSWPAFVHSRVLTTNPRAPSSFSLLAFSPFPSFPRSFSSLSPSATDTVSVSSGYRLHKSHYNGKMDQPEWLHPT